uniref:Uncharacterized protein n=1 Tax=Strongyloides stercoralis TaxID=6248 RepID=A0AAF5DDR3_STRER
MPTIIKLSNIFNFNEFFGKNDRRNIYLSEEIFKKHNNEWKKYEDCSKSFSFNEKHSLFHKQQRILSNLFKTFNTSLKWCSNYLLPIFFNIFNDFLDSQIFVNNIIINESNIKNNDLEKLQIFNDNFVTLNILTTNFLTKNVFRHKFAGEKNNNVNNFLKKLDNYINEKVIPYSYGFDDCM